MWRAVMAFWKQFWLSNPDVGVISEAVMRDCLQKICSVRKEGSRG